MRVADWPWTAPAGAAALTAAYVLGAFGLGYLTLGVDVEGRWLTALVALSAGDPSPALVAYLLVPGVAVGVAVFGLERRQRLRTGPRGDLRTYLVVVTVPVAATAVVAYATALADMVRVLGVAGVPLGLPFAAFFIGVAAGVLLASTGLAVGVGYAVVAAAAAVARRVGTDREPA